MGRKRTGPARLAAIAKPGRVIMVPRSTKALRAVTAALDAQGVTYVRMHTYDMLRWVILNAR
jgi:hypothetical protein